MVFVIVRRVARRTQGDLRANMVSNQSLEIIKLIFGARNDFVRQTAERYCVHHLPGVHVDT